MVLSEEIDSELAAAGGSIPAAAKPKAMAKGDEKESLLELERSSGEESVRSNLVLLCLLASMCEKLGHACFKSAKHIIEFAKVGEKLTNCVHFNQHMLGGILPMRFFNRRRLWSAVSRFSNTRRTRSWEFSRVRLSPWRWDCSLLCCRACRR